MKQLTDFINESISEETYSDGVNQIEEILEKCVKESKSEKEGIESFITDILGNVTNYDLFEALKEYFKK
jgi:hypothetical protein